MTDLPPVQLRRHHERGRRYDDAADADWPAWTGVIPLVRGTPVPAP